MGFGKGTAQAQSMPISYGGGKGSAPVSTLYGGGKGSAPVAPPTTPFMGLGPELQVAPVAPAGISNPAVFTGML